MKKMQYDLYKENFGQNDIRNPFIRTIEELQDLGYNTRSARTLYEENKKRIENREKMRTELYKTPSVYLSGRKDEYNGLTKEQRHELDCCKMLYYYETLLTQLKRKNDLEKKMEKKAAEANLKFNEIITVLAQNLKSKMEKQQENVEKYTSLKEKRDKLKLIFEEQEKEMEQRLDKEITEIDNLIKDHEEREIDPLNRKIRDLGLYKIGEIDRLRRLCSVEWLTKRCLHN